MDEFADIVIEDERWNAAGLEDLAARAFGAAMADLGLPLEGFELALLACDDARIADLNAEFREKPTPTNVLSWPSEDRAPDVPGGQPTAPEPGDLMPESLGDIAISYDTCAREAAEAGKPLDDHVTHLLVHGLLHLLGYDHICDEDAAMMEGREVKILAALGIENPYV